VLDCVRDARGVVVDHELETVRGDERDGGVLACHRSSVVRFLRLDLEETAEALGDPFSSLLAVAARGEKRKEKRRKEAKRRSKRRRGVRFFFLSSRKK